MHTNIIVKNCYIVKVVKYLKNDREFRKVYGEWESINKCCIVCLFTKCVSSLEKITFFRKNIF